MNVYCSLPQFVTEAQGADCQRRDTHPLIGKDRSEDKIITLDVLAQTRSAAYSTSRSRLAYHSRFPVAYCSTTARTSFGNSAMAMVTRSCVRRSAFAYSTDAYSIQQITRFDASQFPLRCDQRSDLVLTDNFEFHIFELPKFVPSSNNIRELPADEKWLYLLKESTNFETSGIDGTVSRARVL